MSALSTIKMTARQFLQLGEDPEGVRLELAQGGIAVSPSPTPDHSEIVLALAGMLRQHAQARGLGRVLADVDTVLGPHDVRRPDLAFIATANLQRIGRQSIEGPPDLCVEVISPASAAIDREEKFALYASAGVRHYWIIDPKMRTLEAFVLRGGRYEPAATGHGDATVHAPPFEDLAIPLGQVWPQ